METLVFGSALAILVLVFFFSQNDISLLAKNPEELRSPEEMERSLSLINDMWNNKGSYASFHFLMKGFLVHHYEKCSIVDCPISCLFSSKKTNIRRRHLKKKRVRSTQDEEKEKIHMTIINYINYAYMKCISIEPDHINLRLSYSLFQIEEMRNSYSAINEIDDYAQNHASFPQQFLIFRYKEIVKESFASNNNGETDKLSIASVLAYENIFQQFKRKIEKICLLYSQFWSMLQEESPDMFEFMQVGFKILLFDESITKMWTNLQLISANIPKTLRLYAGYLHFVVNDKENGKILLAKAEDFTLLKANYVKRKHFSSDLQNSDNASADGSPCILVSGQPSKIGVITDCNLSFCRTFGYVKKDLIGRNVTSLMPDVYGKHHQEVMERHAESAEEADDVTNKERMIFALHKNQYIFPAWFRLVATPNLLSNSNYIGLMNIDKTLINASTAFVLLDKRFCICSISSSALLLLELNISIIKKVPIFLTELIPELFEGNEKKFFLKAGCIAKFYFLRPEVEELAVIAEERHRKLASDRFIKVHCQNQEIRMEEIGVVGYCVKITAINEEELGTDIIKEPKYKSFQFRYEDQCNKFIREIDIGEPQQYLILLIS